MRIIGTFLILSSLLVSIAACANTSKDNKTDRSNMETINLTKADFLSKVYNYEANPKEWKFEGDKPAIVDFYATWCGPCKVLSPILEDLAKEYSGKIDVYKIDVDKEGELAAAFGIQSVPTLLLIPKSGEPMIIQGARSKSDLKKMIDENLLKTSK